MRKSSVLVLTLAFLVCRDASRTIGQDKDKKERTGTVIGELKSRKDRNKGRNIILEILAPGEEKARAYFVPYDLAAKGPDPKVIAAVNTAKVGDRVQCDWAYRGEGGLAVTAFQVLKKAGK